MIQVRVTQNKLFFFIILCGGFTMKCKKKNYGFVPFCKVVKLGYNRRRQYIKAMVWLARRELNQKSFLSL